MKQILLHLRSEWYKYLLELIVITAGVLGAFALNNWNEGRKQKDLEKKYFINLKNDLQADIVGLDTLLNVGQRKILSAKNIRKRADEDSVGSLYDFSNVIYELIFVNGFRPNQTTFDEMHNTGHFSNLKNDSLKSMLLALDRKYEIIDGLQEHIRNDYEVFLENFETHVDWGGYFDLKKSKIPDYLAFDSTRIESNKGQMEIDVLGLLDDKVFLNNVFLIEVNFTYFMPLMEETQSDIQVIINMLDQELK